MTSPEDFEDCEGVDPQVQVAQGNPALKNLLNLMERKGRAKDWRRVALASLRRDGSVTNAARLAGVSNESVYRAMRVSRRFKAAARKAQGIAQKARLEVLEAEIERRAVQGVTKPVFQNGELIGYQRTYSDRLALRLAERLDRKHWAPNSIPRDTVQTQINILMPPNAHAALRNPVVRKLSCQIAAALAAPNSTAQPPVIDVEPTEAE